MKSTGPWLALIALLGGVAPAVANPVTYGQQLCVMLASGISQPNPP